LPFSPGKLDEKMLAANEDDIACHFNLLKRRYSAKQSYGDDAMYEGGAKNRWVTAIGENASSHPKPNKVSWAL